jgi:lysozyme
MSTPTNVIEQLQRDEGFRADIYTDTVGKKTVGYGHNLDANPLPDLTFPITVAQALQILGIDVERISRQLQLNLPWVVSLDDVRHGVLQNMAFNLGTNGLMAFHHMLTFLQAGDYPNTALAMEQSAWFTQVGARAQRLRQQVLTGIWV